MGATSLPTPGTHALRRRAAVAALAVSALLAALLTPVVTSSTYIVPRGADLPAGARVLGALPVADALLVSATSAPQGAAPAAAPLTWRSLAERADPSTGLRVDSGVASTGAPQVWAQTTRGEGALVALVDTGVADMPATAGAVAAEIDFTQSGGGDGYGHGTFLASLIAGRGDVAPGVAPAAQILSLKVATADGSTDLATVLTALQWLSGPGRDAGVQVATLALGVDARSPAGHLLDLAVGRLAAEGVLVVTASGNEAGVLSSPASAPGSFSTGAVDDQTTADRTDDRMAGFSGSGVDRLGVPQPDVVGSGVAIVGMMPCGSVLAVQFPTAFVEGGAERCAAGASEGLFRGSGTSMSAGLTAGVAALAWSANGALGSSGIDAALRAWDNAGDPEGLHAGALDAPSAVDAAMASDAGDDEAPGGETAGPGRPAHAGQPAEAGRPGDPGPQGVNWRDSDWQGVNWRGVNWRDSDWQGVNWRGVNWREGDWQGVNWRGVNWREGDWQGVNWRGVNWREGDWQGVNWRGVNWREGDWQGVNWRGVNWREGDWHGVNWRGVGWSLLLP